MAQWIERYDASVVESHGIPAASVDAAKSASLIVASTAPRALFSVQALGGAVSVQDAVFCEAGLPFARWSGPHLPAGMAS